MKPIGQVTVIALVLLASMAQTKVPDALSEARQLYNDAHYDEAIQLAAEARGVPAMANAASLVFARAHLERYRQVSDAADLGAAREALRTIDGSGLQPRDRVELLIAFGELLYLDDQYGLDDRFSAAAEQFEIALGHADLLDAHSRDLLFDWWASALDRQAQQSPEANQHAIYARILTRAERELAGDDAMASATYWLAAAARGVGDLPRAIGAAEAGWVRAGALGPRGRSLRTDLDALMRRVILPERARDLSPMSDPRPALALLELQWQQVKVMWEQKDAKAK